MGIRSRSRGALDDDERSVLDGLIRGLGPRLLAYVRRVHAHPHDAEDIVSESFCRAAGNMAALRASSRPDLYLLTIARNLCRDRYRRRRPETPATEQLASQAGTIAGPDDLAVRDEQKRALQDAVTALPEPLREIVVLRLSVGLKFEEIAELLHVPLGTALSRMHTAVARLRKTLDVTYDH